MYAGTYTGKLKTENMPKPRKPLTTCRQQQYPVSGDKYTICIFTQFVYITDHSYAASPCL
uniref:Uncharacterized protein n=1 Tax=Anguilla anguilla TaxID=7936 RepID=A0A0E9PJ39_ANGAN